jgi:hypothetical protein
VSNNVKAKVKATREGAKPKMPKVDKGAAMETGIRALFTVAVDDWCKDNIEGKVEKELRGQAVDDLTAQFSSALETNIVAMADCYLDAAFDDDDDPPDDGEHADDDDDDDGEDDNVQDAEFEEVRKRR